MTAPLHPTDRELLDAIESDATPEAAALFTALAAGYLADTRAGEGPVSTRRTLAEIEGRFDEPLPERGRPLAEVAARVARDVLPDCNRLYHPMYIGHQVSAPLPSAIWTESVTAAINNSLAVVEMSPAMTAVERRVIRWLADLAGFGPRAGGTITSGGTEATFTALLAARSAAIPDVWTKGVGDDPPVVVYGEHAHYAITRAVGAMGLGLDRAIAVASRDWRMDPAALERTLDRLAAEGRRVMAVAATAGSTPTGSFDDLEAIGAICERRGLWLHVDGAHGGSALLSDAHRRRLQGLSRARTMAWDPHKAMLLPLSCGVLLARDERDLDRAFAQKAPYLFHGGDDEEARNPDQGVRSFQCSRRADALKLWVALQRHGREGMGALHDRLCGVARRFHELVSESDDFEAAHEPESNILCFRHRGLDDAGNLLLRQRLNASGEAWITTTVLGGVRMLRITVMNPRTGDAEVRRLLERLRAHAATLRATAPR